MREILFKAKAINRDKGYHRTNYKNGDWVYGLITRLYDEQFENLPAEMTDENGVSRIEIDHNTICQYTGLTDKNGNKIWENDVLLQKTTEMHWCKWECMGVVKYGEHDWDASNYGYTSIGFYVEPIVKNGDINKIASGLNQVDINDEYYPIEVIGNIFDNPELLEGEQND